MSHDHFVLNGGLTKYESQEIQKILDWKQEDSTFSKIKILGVKEVTKRIKQGVSYIFPEKATKAFLQALNELGSWATDKNDILEKANVSDLSNLSYKDLELSDRLADKIHNWAIGTAAVEGGVAGIFGILSLPVDLPLLTGFAFRTIHQIGFCYGFEYKGTEQDKLHVLQIMNLASANTADEKLEALIAIQVVKTAIAGYLAQAATIDGEAVVLKSMQDLLGKTIVELAGKVGISITEKFLEGAVPVLGAIANGTLNGAYLRDIGWAARRYFQMQWFEQNKKVEPYFFERVKSQYVESLS